MKTQLKQLFFLSLFCFLCTVFVFYVPLWSSWDDKDNIIWETENNTNKPIVNDNTVKFSWTMRVAIKEWMINNEFRSFVESFKNKYWGSFEFIEVASSDEWNNLEWVDLYIFPYDLLTWVNFTSIDFQEDISHLFIPQIKDFVMKHKDIIPLWFDVPVMYGIDLWDWVDGLLLWSQNWRPSRPVGPYNFWISDNIATYDNSLISTHQIIDFIRFNDIWAFSQWIDFSTPSQELQQWLLSSIQWNSDLCKKHPLPCLIEKKLLWVAWWFHSDYDDDFEWKFMEKKYPYEWDTQFVRLYGIAVDENSLNVSMAFQFILDYMDNAFSEWWDSLSYSLWLVPVFQNEFTNKCYQDACGLESNIDILKDWFAIIKRFYNDSVFRRVVWKKIQPNLYLVNTLI